MKRFLFVPDWPHYPAPLRVRRGHWAWSISIPVALPDECQGGESRG